MQLLAKVSRLVCVHSGVHSARASVTWASACTARAAACAAARAAIEGGARRGRVGEQHRGRHAVALGNARSTQLIAWLNLGLRERRAPSEHTH